MQCPLVSCNDLVVLLIAIHFSLSLSLSTPLHSLSHFPLSFPMVGTPPSSSLLSAVGNFLQAVIFVLAGVPLSYIFWYLRLYNALK